MGKALSGVLADTSVGPFADGGLDEAFGFAVGARSIDAGANVFELEILASLSEEVGVKTGAVIGHDAANGDTQAGEVSDCLAQEFATQMPRPRDEERFFGRKERGLPSCVRPSRMTR
jgi:hypothetical protein